MEETFLEARLLIEKFTGQGDWHGISSNVEDAEVSPENIALLRSALINFAKQHREHPHVGAALWALAGLCDPSLKEFFLIEMRHHYLARRYHPVSQADYALCVLPGEQVDHEYAADELTHEAYFEAVRRFLLNQGKLLTTDV